MAKKHMENASIANYYRNANKTYNGYHHTLVRMVIIKKKKLSTINGGKSVKKRKLSYTLCGNVNWYIPYGKQYGDFFKN